MDPGRTDIENMKRFQIIQADDQQIYYMIWTPSRKENILKNCIVRNTVHLI